MKKKILSVIISFAIVLTLFPLNIAFASDLTVDVPIIVDFSNATGIDLNIRLNPNFVETAKLVNPSESLSDAIYLDNQNDMKVKVSIASVTPLENEGTLFYLRLTLHTPAKDGDELCKLLQVKINEKITWQADNTILMSGIENGKVYEPSVYPNFNEGTATLNGEPFVGGSEVSEDGEYTLVVTDNNGKQRTTVFTIKKTYTISGLVTTCENCGENSVKLGLYDKLSGELQDEMQLVDSGEGSEFSFFKVEAGEYVIKTSCKGFIYDEYQITVADEDVYCNLNLSAYADSNNSDGIDVNDYQQVVNYALSDSHSQQGTAQYDDIIKYDLDFDGVIDVIDASLMSLLLNGHRDLSGIYYLEKGDIDFDGVAFTSDDIVEMEKILSSYEENLEKLSTAEKFICDLNNNGKLDNEDIVLVSK